MSAPFSEDGVGSMMASVESLRVHIEQNARLIDKQTSDEEMQEINQGQRGPYLSPRMNADLITMQPS
jgi:diketogulonate reductase-like aldo/keto reductase